MNEWVMFKSMVFPKSRIMAAYIQQENDQWRIVVEVEGTNTKYFPVYGTRPICEAELAYAFRPAPTNAGGDA